MSNLLALFNLGGGEILLILALILILFGARYLPNMAKGLREEHGHGIEKFLKDLRELFEGCVRLFKQGLLQGFKEFRKAASENGRKIGNETDPLLPFGKRDLVDLITLLLLVLLVTVILALFVP